MFKKKSAPIFAFLLLTQPLFGQTITPNHVFQVTEQIRLELDLLNQANFTSPPNEQQSPAPALPRHVLRSGQDVWRKLQLLRFMNGLSTLTQTEVTSGKVTPGDVKKLMDDIYESMLELRGAYGVTTQAEIPPLPSDKKPTDVYANLTRISQAIDSLGVPATVPNDVYQLAQTVLGDLIVIADAEGLTYNLEAVPSDSGRQPSEAYQAALSLQNEMLSLVEAQPKYAPAGGIIAPKAKTQNIVPRDVLQLLSRSLADIGGMKDAAGIAKPTQDASLEGGKTPSDVFNSITRSRFIIEILAAG